MADLIPRAAAIDAAIDGADDWDGGYNPERERYIREHIAKVPAVDAVPVVRCRDCRYLGTPFDKNDTRFMVAHCEHFDVSHAFSEQFYCASGERRDSE